MTWSPTVLAARPSGPQALLISGTVGAGKTSTADAAGDWLRDRGVPGAVIDLDWLRRCWPSPPEDRFNTRVELVNLAAVARTYLDAGALRLVLAGVLEGPDARAAYRRAVGVPLTVVRLHVDLPVIHQRLQRRHREDLEALRWHLDRSGELDAILTSEAAEDVIVDTTALTIADAALAVIQRVGWDSQP